MIQSIEVQNRQKQSMLIEIRRVLALAREFTDLKNSWENFLMWWKCSISWLECGISRCVHLSKLIGFFTFHCVYCTLIINVKHKLWVGFSWPTGICWNPDRSMLLYNTWTSSWNTPFPLSQLSLYQKCTGDVVNLSLRIHLLRSTYWITKIYSRVGRRQSEIHRCGSLFLLSFLKQTFVKVGYVFCPHLSSACSLLHPPP